MLIHRIPAITVLLFCSVVCSGETFLVITEEIRDGEDQSRPYSSQEGIISAMFDRGYISFDTGMYSPALDWHTEDFQESLAIARQGLADFLVAAQVHSLTEVIGGSEDSAASAADPVLGIQTTVHYYLFTVDSAELLGQGEITLDNSDAETQEYRYDQFLFFVGENIASEILRALD